MPDEQTLDEGKRRSNDVGQGPTVEKQLNLLRIESRIQFPPVAYEMLTDLHKII
jgi:hypothetical protein